MNQWIYTNALFIFSMFFLLATPVQAQQCAIANVVAEPLPCNADSALFIQLGFDFSDQGNAGFSVAGNGNDYGTFGYDDLPISLGPFPGDGTIPFEFVVTDNEHPNCSDFVDLGPVFCNPGGCQIFDLNVETGECQLDTGTYNLWVNFAVENSPNTFFDLIYENQIIGFFALSELPVHIEGFHDNGEPNQVITVCINDHPECCVSADFASPCSGGSNACHISNLVAEPLPCNADSALFIQLDFDFSGQGNAGFSVAGNGHEYGIFGYDELPITLGPFPGDGTIPFEFVVTDNEHPDCSDFVGLGPVFCYPVDCQIFDLNVETGNCNPATGTYSLWLDFAVDSATNSFFDLFVNNESFGIFALSDLPIHIENVPHIGGIFFPNLTVCLNDNPNCCLTQEFGSPCSDINACHIFDLVAEPHPCNDDGTFLIDLDFQFENVGSMGYTVQGNGMNYGTFSYDEPFITLGPFPGDGASIFEFEIIDNEFQCSTFTTLGPINCGGGHCEIFNLFVEVGECHPNGTFPVWMDFDFANVDNPLFEVFNFNQSLGLYHLNELPLHFEDFHGSGEPFELLTVCFSDPLQDCCASVDFDVPICGGGDCHISQIFAEADSCNEDGTFMVFIDFDFQNIGMEGFTIVGNGDNYGTFNYDELPVALGPFAGDGTVYEFLVRDNQFEGCQNHTILEPVFCGDACHLFNVIAEPQPCENGLFYVDLSFDSQNVGTQGYTVRGNGNDYGTFSYDEPFITLGPFQAGDNASHEFVIRDVQHPDCSAETVIGPIDCNPTNCHVFDVEIFPLECHPNGTYSLLLDFQTENSSNDYFDLFTHDVQIGFFPLNALPLTLNYFPASGHSTDLITICINDNPDCCATIEFLTPDCAHNVWPGDANGNNVADNFDLLNIGIAFGSEGPGRVVEGIEWTGLDAENWYHYFDNFTDFKYTDCNGDGIVNEMDVDAINLNYRQEHGVEMEVDTSLGTENDPPLFVELPKSGDLEVGVPFSAPIILGDENNPVSDFYGLAFTLEFDPGIIDPQSVSLAYDPSWLGVQNVNLLTIDKTFASQGIIELALVRNDQNNVSGFGQIAAFIGVIDNIAGKEEVSIGIKRIRAIRKNEVRIPLHAIKKTVDIVTATKDPEPNNFIELFPNPTSDVLQINNNMDLPIQSLEIRDLRGRVVARYSNPKTAISMKDFASGIYLLKMKVGDRFYFQRIAKM